MSTIIDALDDRIGAQIRIEREHRGWSLTDLAQRSGVSRAMINKVERGAASPTASLLGRLAGAFGLTLSMLLARTETDHMDRLVRANEQSRWIDPETRYIRRQIAPAPGSDIPLDVVQIELPAGMSYAFASSLLKQWQADGIHGLLKRLNATNVRHTCTVRADVFVAARRMWAKAQFASIRPIVAQCGPDRPDRQVNQPSTLV